MAAALAAINAGDAFPGRLTDMLSRPTMPVSYALPTRQSGARGFMAGSDRPELSQSERLAIAEHRLDNYDRVLQAIQSSTAEISRSLSQIVRFEERLLNNGQALDRAFKLIGDLQNEIQKINNEMPTMKLVRSWVITTVFSMFGLAAAIVLSVVTT